MLDTTPLENLGLTDGEIKVYLALITLGESTSGPIIDESGVSVSKVYQILERLEKKGLASHTIKQKTKYFRSATPKRLLQYLKEKQYVLQHQEEALKKLMPQLEAIREANVTPEAAQVFQGMRGLQTARERTLSIMDTGDEMWVIGISRSPYDGPMVTYFEDYHKRRIEKGIFCRYLYNEYAREPFGEASAKYPHSKVKYLPEGIITHSWIEIYADTVTISVNTVQKLSVVIQNRDVAHSFKEYARLLWEKGTS